MVQTHCAVAHRRPGEALLLLPLVDYHQAGAVPEGQLQPVGPLGPEDEDGAGERIPTQCEPFRPGQAVMGLTVMPSSA